MTTLRYAARALALSFSLTAAGASCVVGTATAADAATDPVGGRQLAARGVIVNLRPGVPAPPAMPGASYLIADLDTGQILAAKAPHIPRLPASTLKTLTALTLIPRLDPNAKIIVKAQDVRVEGSRLGILPGTAYSVGTLLQGLMMASGNDAAYALARGNRGVAVTLRQMNATAADLQAFDTTAKDPSGLDKAGQTTSAYDLALIGRAAMKLPDFRRYVVRKRAVLPGGRSLDGKPRPAVKVGSHNKLLYNYRGAIGIKTGYTNAAKHTYVGAATRAGKTYILTQMASPNGSWRPSAALLDWAFAHGTSVTPIGKLVDPTSATTSTPTSGPNRPQALSPGSVGGSARESPSGSGLPPWLGVAGLISAMALVGGWTARTISRQRT